MKDMGVPTFLITATVEAILAQRLVRRICTQCREETTPTPEMLQQMGLTPEQIRTMKFYRGAGCDVCNNTGYKGRVGLFELMIITDKLRDMIMENASVDDMRTEAQSNGMVSLRDAGLSFVGQGVTTAEEILRETILEA
jgi:type IV pilus assembly protein PilB